MQEASQAGVRLLCLRTYSTSGQRLLPAWDAAFSAPPLEFPQPRRLQRTRRRYCSTTKRGLQQRPARRIATPIGTLGQQLRLGAVQPWRGHWRCGGCWLEQHSWR